MPLSGSITTVWDLAHTKSGVDLATPSIALRGNQWKKTWTVASGTGANQADLIWHDKRTLADAADDDLDLAGVLADVYGATITAARIKAIRVWRNASYDGVAEDASASRLIVGGSPSAKITTPWLTSGGGVYVHPDGYFELVAPGATGYAITATTADILRLTHDSDADALTITYRIALLMASA